MDNGYCSDETAEILNRFFSVHNWTPYELRVVDNTEIKDWIIDTCYCDDIKMFETAVCRNNSKIIIVERYKDKDKAKGGHIKWVERCKENPKKLYDVQINEFVKTR